MIQQCRILLNQYFPKITLKTHDSALTSSHPLDLVVLLRIYASIWKTCHVWSCNNRNKFLILTQIMNLQAPVHQIREPVLSQSLTQQVLMKVIEKEVNVEENKALYAIVKTPSCISKPAVRESMVVPHNLHVSGWTWLLNCFLEGRNGLCWFKGM